MFIPEPSRAEAVAGELEGARAAPAWVDVEARAVTEDDAAPRRAARHR